jgi:hypothetical protein
MKATRPTPTPQAASLPDPLTPRLPASLSSFLTLSTLCFLPRTSLRTTNHEPRTLVLPLVISCRNHVVSRRFRVVFGRFWSFQVGIFTDKNLRKPHFKPNFALLPLIFAFFVPDRAKWHVSQLNQPGEAVLNFAILSLIFDFSSSLSSFAKPAKRDWISRRRIFIMEESQVKRRYS